MLLDLVIWSFMLVLAPLALGLVWNQGSAVVQGLASTVHGPSTWPDEGNHFPPYA
jgi:hypothetical protein